VRQIRWTTDAFDELVAAVKRIQEDNPATARNVAQTVIDRIEQLTSPPYVVVYRYTDEIVEILDVWHGAQEWR
jgi:plasmid stabilization system protein ParE